MFDESIKSLGQASEYFKAMGCSHFHMAREYPQRYDEYIKFNISKQQETEWITERLDEYYNNIVKNKNDISLWIIHSNMDELVRNLKTEIALEKMLEVTQYIRDIVPFKDRVIISETINGRGSHRSGLIYLAYDLNNIFIAKAFVELSLHFAAYTERKTQDFERCQSASKLCNDIMVKLKLDK